MRDSFVEMIGWSAALPSHCNIASHQSVHFAPSSVTELLLSRAIPFYTLRDGGPAGRRGARLLLCSLARGRAWPQDSHYTARQTDNIQLLAFPVIASDRRRVLTLDTDRSGCGCSESSGSQDYSVRGRLGARIQCREPQQVCCAATINLFSPAR